MKVLTPQQLNVLGHPCRPKILEAIRLLQTASIREVALEIGEAQSYTTYHVNQLVSAGLIEFVAKRTVNHRAEAVFQLAQNEIKLAEVGSRMDRAEELWNYAKSSLRSTRKEIEEASQGPEIEDVHFSRWIVRLTPENRVKVNSLLAKLKSAMTSEDGDPYTFTVALVPTRH